METIVCEKVVFCMFECACFDSLLYDFETNDGWRFFFSWKNIYWWHIDGGWWFIEIG